MDEIVGSTPLLELARWRRALPRVDLALCESWRALWLSRLLVLGGAALVGVARQLPLAYGAYALAALALPLSYPVGPQPLMSLPRFLLVLFPLYMWGGLALARRPRLRAPVLALSGALLALFTAQFATWHWVA